MKSIEKGFAIAPPYTYCNIPVIVGSEEL